MGVVDQTHDDNHGQQLLELSFVVDLFIPDVYVSVQGGVVSMYQTLVCSMWSSNHQLEEIEW